MANPEDFRKYLRCDRRTHEKGILFFLAELSQSEGEAAIKRVCIERLGKLNQLVADGEPANTVGKMGTAYRNSIRAYQAAIELNDSNSFENPGGKVEDTANGRTHYALKYLALGKKFHTDRNDPTKAKRKINRQNRQQFDPFAAIERAEKALKSNSYLEAAVAFEFLTGRRFIEVMRGYGYGKPTYRYTLEFSGQAKVKPEDRKPFEIYTLTEASSIIDAMVRIQRDPSVKELEDSDNPKIGTRRLSSYNTAVRRIFGDIIPPIATAEKISSHDLRTAYATAASILFRLPTEDPAQFAERILGHKSSESTAHYQSYVCLQDGEEIPCGQWSDRLLEEPGKAASKHQTSVRFDGLRLERLYQVQAKTHGERLDAALDAYELVPTLKNRIAELERQITAMTKATTETPAAASGAKTNEWANVPSEELQGSQAPGSAEEKIRRAVAAIIEHNQGKEPAAQYRLSEANVRYLSGSRHGTVKSYFAVHPEVSGYDAAHQFSTQHDRGKTPITEVIAW